MAGAQLLGGVGSGAALSIGSLLAVDLSGSEAWAGSITTLLTLAAAFTAIPMASLAAARGRRMSLTISLLIALAGAVLMIAAASLRAFPLLLLGGAALGLGTTANLQSRFAATDLASTHHRGRDLSIVVWATTIGAVTGPNLIKPGAQLGALFGLPEMAGPFLFSAAAMVCAVILLNFGLRPDPLLTAQALGRQPLRNETTQPDSSKSVRPARNANSARKGGSLKAGFAAIRSSPRALLALATVIASHVVMVSVMSMTPLHLKQVDEHAAMGHQGMDVLAIIGVSISLHIAGMFALSPLFGWLSDRFGRIPVIVGGQLLLLGSAAVAGFGQANAVSVTVGLVMLGLGWSASTIAGATLLSESVPAEQRVLAQGVSDTLMGFSAAVGSILSGLVLASWGYGGLNLIASVLAAVVLAYLLSASLRRGRASAGY
nr:MFS transporter [Psychromicrobium silvestre]